MLFVGVVIVSCVNSLGVNFEWKNVQVFSNYSRNDGVPVSMVAPQDLILSADLSGLYLADTGNGNLIHLNLSTGETQVLTDAYTSFSLVQVPVRYSQGNWTYDPLGSSLLYGRYAQLVLCSDFSTSATCTTYPVISDFITGLSYDANTTLVYASILLNKKVLAFNLSNPTTFLSSPVRVYGRNDTNASTSSSSLDNPRKTTLDCQGGLWVADTVNSRVLHFPAGSTTPDIVLGQPDFTTNTPGVSDHKFVGATGVALDRTCSVLFVSDYNRVLRFRAPFHINSTAEAVLGFDSFSRNYPQPPTTSGFNSIFSLRFEDFDNGMGRLYVVDRYNNRTISGVTFIGVSDGTHPLSCNNVTNSPSQTCQVSGDVYVTNGQVLTFSYSQLSVEGDLRLDSNTTLQLTPGQVITVGGILTFAGTLILNTSSQPVVVATYNQSRGTFKDIQVVGVDQSCQATTKANYGLATLIVTVDQECSGGGGDGSRRNIIIGVVVGVGGCIIITILLVVIVGTVVILYQRRDKLSRARKSVRV